MKKPALSVLVACLAMLVYLTAFAEDKAEKESPVVKADMTVMIHYTLTVDGKVIDSSEGRQPFEFQTGKNQTIPGFEKALIGMKTGEKKSFAVSPEEGYGQEDPKAYHEISKEKLPQDVKPEAGMMLYVQAPDGNPYPVKISEVREETVIINFNHPLAGKTLNFDVEVVEIK